MNISFDNKEKNFCLDKCGYSISFELSNNSMEYLYQIISNMPVISDDDKDKRRDLGFPDKRLPSRVPEDNRVRCNCFHEVDEWSEKTGLLDINAKKQCTVMFTPRTWAKDILPTSSARYHFYYEMPGMCFVC